MLHLDGSVDTQFGTVINYTCPVGFLLPNGQPYEEVVCQDNARWSSRLEVCERKWKHRASVTVLQFGYYYIKLKNI